ncbi:unnamed protein product [Didymodactylos carnosus]|uniref:Uncharacterized protein n=1 Tax=Didymodactylos carnosus TaxID=1234261 RepID=A0A815QQ52_9BILA|nr:unnamed protein product [Didymodactylos carnosus]CAF4335531.1 unnamed protein product [Didymodactylos carnosus]
MNSNHNQLNRPRTNDNNRQGPHSTVQLRQSVNRALNLANDSHEYYDKQTNVQYNPRFIRQSRVPAPVSSNLQPINSPAQTPSRRSRDDYEDNEGYTTVINKRSRKNQNYFMEEENYDQEEQQNYDHYNHRYPTRYKQQTARQIDQHTIASVSGSQQQNQQTALQQQTITTEATRYAQTRFPFVPCIIRFASGDVKENQVAEQLVNHFKDNHQSEIQIANIRRSTLKCQQNEYE